MYEEIKVGTVIQTKDIQLIFVGYENPYIMVFYEYSPDMLRSFSMNKQWRLCIGFEVSYPYVVKKQLDDKRLRAWYIKNQLVYNLPTLSSVNKELEIMKPINILDLMVFDVFLSGVTLYIYLGKTFSDEYICYDLSEVTENTLRLVQNGNVSNNNVIVRTSMEELYFVKHLDKKTIQILNKLHYGEYL